MSNPYIYSKNRRAGGIDTLTAMAIWRAVINIKADLKPIPPTSKFKSKNP